MSHSYWSSGSKPGSCLKTIKHTVSSVCNAFPCTPSSLPSAHLTHSSTSHHPFILARLRTGIWLSGQDRSCTIGSQKTNKMKLSSFLKSIIAINCCCCRSVARSCLTLQPYGLWHTRLPCPSLSPGVCSNSCPLSECCHPATSSSVTPFSSIFPSIRVFKVDWISSLRQVARVLELQRQSFQWIFRVDFL